MSIAMQHVALIGLGLIGGSLGLALRQAAGEAGAPRYSVIGYDSDPQRLRQAEQRGVVDQTSKHLAEAVQDAQIVMLATPVLAIRGVLAEIAPHLRAGAIVTDTASTKAAVLGWARELLPAGARFIGGHPMAGSTGSLEEARPDLFKGAAYCLVTNTTAEAGLPVDAEALQIIHDLIAVLGARPLLLDAETHDRCVAAISHLPFVTSIALVETVAESAGRDLMRQLASSGFRDATRLAAGDPAMYQSIVLTNRTAIMAWLDGYMEQLQAIRQMLQSAQEWGDEGLLALFRDAQRHRKEIMG
jgi:prephenate dehydrogenase